MFRPRPITPKKGQESVWDYPRPPLLEKVSKHLKVIFNGEVIASSNQGFRVLETSHPPNYYIPLSDCTAEFLEASTYNTFCEWKGQGSYYHVKVGDKLVENACWFYDTPTQDFKAIKNYVAFYASKMDQCFVGDELVTPQPGGFYGGWITKDIVGPFKGIEGSFGW